MRNIGVRFFVVGLLTLLMVIPLMMVGGLVDDRQSFADQARDEISREWGGPQVIFGPVVVVPVEGPVTRVVTDGGVSREVTRIEPKSPLYLLPDTFDAQVTTQSSLRQRGIFESVVYSATAVLNSRFPTDPSLPLAAGEVALWDKASVELRLSDNRGMRGETVVTQNGDVLTLEPMDQGGLIAAIADPRGAPDIRVALTFNGAQRLQVSPVGRASDIRISGDWPDPSFTGAFLPDSRQVTDAGFSAEWSIPHLARALPSVSRDRMRHADDYAMGLRYLQTNDFYRKAYRAATYSVLFIALTFLTVLLMEDRTRPVHAVQYILIGLAQCVFVLLMVAYAEQVGFGLAYLGAAGATILLLLGYAITGLKFGRRAWVLGALLLVLYGVLYLIMDSVDYALVLGATLLFAALATTMFATRNEDWQAGEGISLRRRGTAGDPPPDQGRA